MSGASAVDDNNINDNLEIESPAGPEEESVETNTTLKDSDNGTMAITHSLVSDSPDPAQSQPLNDDLVGAEPSAGGGQVRSVLTDRSTGRSATNAAANIPPPQAAKRFRVPRLDFMLIQSIAANFHGTKC